MAYDELQRDPPQLMADFIEHTRDACWDLQFYSERCLNHGIEQDPVIGAFINVLIAFRACLRQGVDPDGQLIGHSLRLTTDASHLALEAGRIDNKIMGKATDEP